MVLQRERTPVRLATEEEGEEAAYAKYDALMAGKQPVTDDCLVIALLERFLEHKKSKAPATYDFYATPSIPSPTSLATRCESLT